MKMPCVSVCFPWEPRSGAEKPLAQIVPPGPCSHNRDFGQLAPLWQTAFWLTYLADKGDVGFILLVDFVKQTNQTPCPGGVSTG